MTEPMTLEEVRDWHKDEHWKLCAQSHSPSMKHKLMADAIDAHLAKFTPDWVGYRQGLEDGKAEALAQPAQAVDVPMVDEHGMAFVEGLGWVVQCSKAAKYAATLYRALSGEKAGPVDDAKDAERYRRFRAALLNKPGDMEAFYMKAVADTEAEFDAAVDATLPASPTPDKEG